MSKNAITTISYLLLIISVTFPILYFLGAMLFAQLLSFTTSSAELEGLGFIIAIIGLPLCAFAMTTGIILSFSLGLFAKQKEQLIISLIPLAGIAYATYQAASSPIRPGDGLMMNTGAVLFSCPLWAYVGYIILLFIMSAQWFHKMYKHCKSTQNTI